MSLKRLFRTLIAAAIACGSWGGLANATTGPVMQPLRVTVLYTVDTSWVFVAFQDGSMPGCYGNSGAVLMQTNVHFKEIYAQLLMMIAMSGVKALVFYSQNTPTNNWSDCTLEGLELVP